MFCQNHSRRRSLVLAGITVLLILIVGSVRLGRNRWRRGHSSFLSPDTAGMALCLYKLDVGNYPIGLEALIQGAGIKGWSGPYLQMDRIAPDRWGVALRYSRSAQGYELRSAGPDKAFNTADDVVVSRAD